MTDAGVKHLAGLCRLQTLVLSRCAKLTHVAFEAFGAAYPVLRFLDVAYCRIGYEGTRVGGHDCFALSTER